MLINLLTLFCSLTATADVPEPIRRLQNALVEDHGCEADWPALLAENGTREIAIDAYTTLIAVPCARWSLNLSYRVYAIFNEPKTLYEQVTFAHVDPDGAIVARDEVYNAFTWDDDRRELTSIYRYDAGLDCGSRTIYRWDPAKLRFAMVRVYLKAACDRTLTPWPELRLYADRGARGEASPGR